MQKIADFLGDFKRHVPVIPSLAVFIAAIVGADAAFISSKSADAAVLWLLAAAILLTYFYTDFKTEDFRTTYARTFGMVFLAVSAGLSAIGAEYAALMFLLLSPLTFFGNGKLFAYAFFPVMIWTFALPNFEFVRNTASFPMRAFSAWSAAELLSALGLNAVSNGTMILFEGRDIAITSACGGIDQLEVMALAAWVLAAYLHKNSLVRLLHFLSIAPIILVCNTLRVVVSMLLVKHYGDAFLSGFTHTLLGVLTVVVCMILFVALGFFFGKDAEQND